MVNVKENHSLTGDGDIFSGILYSGGSGSALYGGVENSVLAPCSGLFVSAGYVSGTNIKEWGTSGGGYDLTGFANSSLFEGTPFPRAIVSDMISYYM